MPWLRQFAGICAILLGFDWFVVIVVITLFRHYDITNESNMQYSNAPRSITFWIV